MITGQRTVSPYDRGSADAYYWRGPEPHYYSNGWRIPASEMTADQIASYHRGYAEEYDRKDYFTFGCERDA